MSTIVSRLPFYDHQTVVRFAEYEATERPNQIVVWISLRLSGVLSPPFPAILDTGHSHFLSIGEEHLDRWAGFPRDRLRAIGRARVNEQPVELFAAGVVLHRNRPKSRDELLPRPHVLTIPQGIAVHTTDPPRLPLLGLRALVESRLRVVIDGERRQVTIGAPRRFWGSHK